MDTLEQNGARFERMPLREDGTVDLNELARSLLEGALNAAMDAAADELLGEGNRRNGYRERELRTCVGTVTLRIPKLREGSYFPDEVVRPYSRADRAMVAAVAEVYRLGMSHRKIERAAAKLGFGELSSSTVSRMCESLDEEVSELREGRLAGPCRYLWLDATYLSCRDGGRVRGKAVVTALALMPDGSRAFAGAECVDTESRASWREFLLSLRRRGVSGVLCVVSDDHAGLVRAVREVFPEATWQRCVVHLMRDVAGRIGRAGDRRRALAALKAVFAERDPRLVRAMYDRAAAAVGAIDRRAGEVLEDARDDALAYLDFPPEHHVRLRTNNVQERANREIKRRANAVQTFPSEASLMRLVGAVCVQLNEEWATRRFMNRRELRAIGRAHTVLRPAGEELEERAARLLEEAMAAA